MAKLSVEDPSAGTGEPTGSAGPIAVDPSRRARRPLAGAKGDPVLASVCENPRERNAASPDESRWTELAELVGRAQSGDREAFGLLVEQFERTVYAICLRRLGNTSEALELTQDVFLHVMKRVGQLREPERFAGWLRQVTVRMAINRATRRLPPNTVEDDVLEGSGEVQADPLAVLIARERAQRLHDGLGRLKAIDREVLGAFYLQGQSLVEIAESFDAPVGTIKRRLHTARKRLKVVLEGGVADAREWSDSSRVEELDEEFVDSPYELCL